MVGHPPRAFPWEQYLPWAPVRVRQSTALQPEGAARARGSVSARDVGASTSPGAGTSATARIRNVSGRSIAGRRHDGKPDIASTPRPEPAMPRLRRRAATAPGRHLSPLMVQRLRRRVVTRQNVFFPAVMRSTGLPRAPRVLAPQPRPLLRARLPAGRSPAPRPGTQVALPRHLGWAEEARHRVSGRSEAPRLGTRPSRPLGTVATTSAMTVLPG
jgi:hypothetical protein